MTFADNVMVMWGLSGDMETTLLWMVPFVLSSIRGRLYDPKFPPEIQNVRLIETRVVVSLRQQLIFKQGIATLLRVANLEKRVAKLCQDDCYATYYYKHY